MSRIWWRSRNRVRRRCSARWRAGSDDGMATAEMAVAMPSLVVVLAAAVGLLHAVGAELRCADAARLAARAAARGEPAAAVVAQARAAAPAGSTVSVTRKGDTYDVSVTARLGIPGPWSGSGPHWEVSGAASGPAEPDSAQLDSAPSDTSQSDTSQSDSAPPNTASGADDGGGS
jgi:hypothetical protein